MKLLDKALEITNDMKIRKKLIYIYLLVVLIPVMFVGIYLTSSMKDMVMQRAITEACINTDRIQDRLTETLRKVTEVSDKIYVDNQLKKIATTRYEGQYEAELKILNDYANFTALDEYIHFYNELNSIRFYVNNETLLDNSQFIKATDAVKKAQWYKDAVKNDGRISWIYNYDYLSEEHYLSLVRLVKDSNQNPLGVLVINVSNNYLSSIIKEEPYETIATVKNGDVVLAQNSKILGEKTTLLDPKLLSQSIHNYQSKTQYDGKDSIIIANTFSLEKTSDKLGIISIVHTDDIVSKTKQVSLLGFTIIGISLVISLGMILFFTNVLSKRIINLRREMHKVVNGDFNIDRDFKGTDEIGELHEDLNIMIDSIQQLIHEVYEEKLQKEQLYNRQREVELKMLASQINPHFLYNTLETIRMKAHCNKQPEIATIVKMLANLMRRNLAVSDRLVSLESEIELVKNYLEIQRFRFGERISYEININCDIDKYEILPLLIQPIVENAFVHGLESKEGSGHIRININRNKEFLIISVIDNGVGIESSQLELLISKMNNFIGSGKKSIGLSNVNQRVKLLYGDKYFLKLQSKLNEGTQIDLYLPKGEEELFNVEGIGN